MKHTKRFLLLGSLAAAMIFTMPYLIKDAVGIEMDTFFHLARIQSLSLSIRSGNLYPLIFPDQNGGYGYGSPMFYCNLLLWPFAFLHVLGIPLSVCWVLLILSCCWLTCWTMAHFLNHITKDPVSSLMAAAVYLLASYRMSDVYVRGALGEVLAMAFLPVLLEGIYEIVFESSDSITAFTLGLCGLVFSHNLTFAMGVFLFLLICLVFYRRLTNRAVCAFTKAAVLAFLFSAWFTLPMLEQLMADDYYLNYYASSMNLGSSALSLRAFVQYGLKFGVGGYGMANGEQMTLSPGYLLMCIPLLSLLKQPEQSASYNRPWVRFCLIAGYVTMLLTLDIVPWKDLQFLGILQFPWRLETLACALLAVPCAIGINHLIRNQKAPAILLALIIGFDGTVRLMGVYSRTFTIHSSTPDSFLTDGTMIDPYYSATYMRTQLAGGDYLPLTSLDFRTYVPEVTLNETTEGKQFEITSAPGNPLTILPVTWYKGYRVYLLQGEQRSPVSIQEVNGLIAAQITSPGSYRIVYAGTPLQKAALTSSLVTLVFVVIRLRRRRSCNHHNRAATSLRSLNEPEQSGSMDRC